MTAPVKRGRRGPRRALTEDEILDAALSLLDDGGPNAASVRGIAAKVGVAPNAVYTYFPDKAAVVKALVERLLGEVDHDVFADRDPAVAVTRGGAGPGAAGAADGAPRRRPPDDRRPDGRPACARPERTAPRAARRRRAQPHRRRPGGLPADRLRVRLDRPGSRRPAPAGPLPPESERIASRHRAFAATPADRYPRAAAAAATLAGYISTPQYRWGLHRVLDGITTHATTDPETPARCAAQDNASAEQLDRL